MGINTSTRINKSFNWLHLIANLTPMPYVWLSVLNFLLLFLISCSFSVCILMHWPVCLKLLFPRQSDQNKDFYTCTIVQSVHISDNDPFGLMLGNVRMNFEITNQIASYKFLYVIFLKLCNVY